MTMSFRDSLCIILLMLTYITVSNSLHLVGTWQNQDDFFLFLAKFGFQQSTHDTKHTNGYIYGNISSGNVTHSGLTLALVDSEFFVDFYGNRTTLPRPKACHRMFGKIDTAAYNSRCFPYGPEDFLRKIPCPKDKLCVDEDNPDNVIPGYQFTYTVQDVKKPRYMLAPGDDEVGLYVDGPHSCGPSTYKPTSSSPGARFWYLSFVSCRLNSTDVSHCRWQNQPQVIDVHYDIWLVNGHPFTKHINPFEHQFSFEQHDVFEIHVTFLLLCTLLIPLWLYAYRKQPHKLTQLFTACICLETAGILCNFIHTLKFAFDGQGVFWLHICGDAIDNFAECLFVLLLLVIAKGWAITTRDLTAKVPLFIIWSSYTVLNAALFIWNLTELDVVSNTEEWETWPGYITLGFRMAIMFWFLYELRKTSLKERNFERLQFFQHFGAGFLVWFIYLPILAVITTQVSSLWKRKTTLSITYSADFLAFAVLVHLLWPSRTALNFVQKETPLPPDELEVAGLLESEPTFREIERDVTYLPKENGQKLQANGTVKNKNVKTKTGAHFSKEDQVVLLSNDEFSDYDSL